MRLDVRFGSKADACHLVANVRFVPEAYVRYPPAHRASVNHKPLKSALISPGKKSGKFGSVFFGRCRRYRSAVCRDDLFGNIESQA